MFAIPGLVALLVFVYLRPQEVFEPLSSLNFAAIAGVVVVGIILDWRLAESRPRWSLMLFLGGLFFGWSILSALARSPEGLGNALAVSAAAWLTFLFISQSVQSFRALETLVVTLLACSILLALVGIKQGLSPTVCILRTGSGDTGAGSVVTDGRACQTSQDCEHDSPDPEAEYFCERAGPLGTSTIAGRVRYRGIVQDPNELAWVLSLSVPLCFALFERRRSLSRFLLAAGTTIAVMTCVVMTKSRSGQLSLLTVLGVYFIRRFRWKGAVVGALLALPLLALGGRSGAEAESSSTERLECWQAGLQMWKGSPFLGVGYRNFGEHHYLTAHNSFILTLAELGPLGLLMWSLLLYASIKMLVRALRDFGGRPETQPAAQWAMGLLAGILGTTISTFFLSIAYHGILWVLFGLVAAYFAAVRRHHPGWKVSFRVRDVVMVGLFDVGLIMAIALYIRLRGV